MNLTTDDDHMTTEDAFAKLASLIEAAHKNDPGGNFFLEVPTAEWEAMESSLNRSRMARKFASRVFVWRGEYVTRGAKWFVHGVEE